MLIIKVKNLIIPVIVLIVAISLFGCSGGGISDDVMVQIGEETPYTAPQTQDSTDSSAVGDDIIYVYVCGAVNNAGVYKIAVGSRLYEAVELAGGFTDDADEACLNLAREVKDGEQIIIRTVEEAQAAQEAACGDGLVNINTASAAELTTISGIGESRAQAIIAYREANGGFGSIEDIKKVEGIKDGLFAKIKDKITV